MSIDKQFTHRVSFIDGSMVSFEGEDVMELSTNLEEGGRGTASIDSMEKKHTNFLRRVKDHDAAGSHVTSEQLVNELLQYEVGSYVEHSKWGMGQVKAVKRRGQKSFLKIRFKRGRQTRRVDVLGAQRLSPVDAPVADPDEACALDPSSLLQFSLSFVSWH